MKKSLLTIHEKNGIEPTFDVQSSNGQGSEISTDLFYKKVDQRVIEEASPEEWAIETIQ
jgi:hypothetical protein